jgi:hypothetical protein
MSLQLAHSRDGARPSWRPPQGLHCRDRGVDRGPAARRNGAAHAGAVPFSRDYSVATDDGAGNGSVRCGEPDREARVPGRRRSGGFPTAQPTRYGPDGTRVSRHGAGGGLLRGCLQRGGGRLGDRALKNRQSPNPGWRGHFTAMWGKADDLRLSVLMGLCKGLRLVRGIRRS